ncbi:MAG: MtrAB system histidine kinase MtrB [Candidatus Nanopelagicaceae bacterium]
MNLTRWLRHSLAARVVISTSILSLAAIWIAGSALYTQLSSGIKGVKYESSISDTKATVYALQYQFLLAGENPKAIQKAINDLSTNGTVFGTTTNTAPYLIFVPSPGTVISKNNYTTISPFLTAKMIPEALRKTVREDTNTHSSYQTITNTFGLTSQVLVVGNQILVPQVGKYELYLLFNLENQSQTLQIVSNSLIGTGLALVLLVALVTTLVVRQVVRPVREAAKTAEALASGDLGKRMDVHGDDEIARLGSAFNEMANSLQMQINRLENLSHVQQRFVGDVTHELRTPLTTLRMAAGLIHSSKKSFDPTLQRSVELMMMQLDRFERLLEDLLEISRFDAEVAAIEPVEFDVSNLISKSIDDLRMVASEAGIHIELDRPADSIYIKGDIRRIERIMRNLLTNAIDHAEGKPIKVTVRQDEHSVAVSVRDHGIGLDKESALRVFDRFWRADPSRSRTRGGTGLGLSMALEDARLHNGELEVYGEPGKGANFVLTLPKQAGGDIPQRIIPLKF